MDLVLWTSCFGPRALDLATRASCRFAPCRFAVVLECLVLCADLRCSPVSALHCKLREPLAIPVGIQRDHCVVVVQDKAGVPANRIS